MEKKFKRTLVTTALPYANGPVHIGHLAGVYVPADIYTRYMRLRGEDVVMVGGSDEHGVPITIKAREEGVTPQDIGARSHKIIKDSMEELGISFDVYSRTTSDIHSHTASEFFRHLYDAGKLEWRPPVAATAPTATSARHAARRSTPPTSSIPTRASLPRQSP